MQYTVIIEETVSGEFVIEATTKKEAIVKAMQKYSIGEFILEPGELQTKRIAISNTNEDFEWIEF